MQLLYGSPESIISTSFFLEHLDGFYYCSCPGYGCSVRDFGLQGTSSYRKRISLGLRSGYSIYYKINLPVLNDIHYVRAALRSLYL